MSRRVGLRYPHLQPTLMLPSFKPRNLNHEIPIYLSRRVGIRSIASLIGKRPPLHPAYVCWYDSCEDLASWTIAAQFDPSIDYADYRENVGSLYLRMPVGAAGSYSAANYPFVFCGQYVGFWAQIAHTRYAEMFRAVLDGSNYMGFYTLTNDNWGLIVVVGGIQTTYDSGVSCLPLGTWFWLEMCKVDVGNRYRFRINGTGVWELATADFGTPTYFLVDVSREPTVVHGVKVDYLRVSDRFEYPPA